MPLPTVVRPLLALFAFATLSLSVQAAGTTFNPNLACRYDLELCQDPGLLDGGFGDGSGDTGGSGGEYWQTIMNPAECFESFQAEVQNAERAREEYLANARNNATDANGNFNMEYYDLAVQSALETYYAAYDAASAQYEDCINEFYNSEEEPEF